MMSRVPPAASKISQESSSVKGARESRRTRNVSCSIRQSNRIVSSFVIHPIFVLIRH
jgi:hypothetical protein